MQVIFEHGTIGNEYCLIVKTSCKLKELEKKLAYEKITVDKRIEYIKVVNRHLAALLACQYVTKRLDGVGRQINREIQETPYEQSLFENANNIMGQIAEVIQNKKNNPEFVYFDYDKYRKTCENVSNYLINITEIIKNDSNSLAELSIKLDNDCYVCPINTATSSASIKPSVKLSTIKPASIRRQVRGDTVSLKVATGDKNNPNYSDNIIDSTYFATFRTYNIKTHAIDDIAETYFSANDKENMQVIFKHGKIGDEYCLIVKTSCKFEEVQKALADEKITVVEYNKMINRHLAAFLACKYVTKKLVSAGYQINRETKKTPYEKKRFKDANSIREQIAKVIQDKKNNPEFVYFDYDKYRKTCKRVSNYLMNITEIIKNDSNSLAELSKKLDNDCYVCPINIDKIK